MTGEGANRLTQAVIVQAAQEYKSSLRGYGRGGKPADAVRRECERFFRSDWFMLLTNGRIDGEYVIGKIRDEVEAEKKGKPARVFRRKKG